MDRRPIAMTGLRPHERFDLLGKVMCHHDDSFDRRRQARPASNRGSAGRELARAALAWSVCVAGGRVAQAGGAE